MNYRRLGKSGLKISVISYGFWAMFSSQPDVDLALACLTAVYGAGCNYFDNAEVYGNGQSELLMGAALKKAGWSRDSYIVSSMEAHSVVCQYNLIPPTMEQPQYNLLHRYRVEQEYKRLYDTIGLGTTVFSPLAASLVTGVYNDGIPADALAS